MDTIITNKGTSKYPTEAAYKYLIAKIQIHRPSDFLIKIDQVINVNVEDKIVPHIYTDTFGITSTKKPYVFDDYTPSLDDFNFYRYSNNIPYIKVILKIIDGNLYLCVSEDGRYEITIKDLANTAATYSRVYIGNIEKDGLYKDPELVLNHPILFNNDLGYTQLLDKNNFTNGFFLGKEFNPEGKVLKITSSNYKPFYCKFRFILGNYAHGICEILQNETIWNIKWLYYKPMDTNIEIKSNGINLYIYFKSSTIMYLYNCRTLNDISSISLIEPPSDWDSLTSEGVNNLATNISDSDILGNSKLLEEGVYTYKGRPCIKVGDKMIGGDSFNILFSRYGTTDESPELGWNDRGFIYYDLSFNKIKKWNGQRWTDSNGYTLCINSGPTIHRPTNLHPEDVGLQFFDKTLGKPIYVYSVSEEGIPSWVDATGVEV